MAYVSLPFTARTSTSVAPPSAAKPSAPSTAEPAASSASAVTISDPSVLGTTMKPDPPSDDSLSRSGSPSRATLPAASVMDPPPSESADVPVYWRPGEKSPSCTV